MSDTLRLAILAVLVVIATGSLSMVVTVLFQSWLFGLPLRGVNLNVRDLFK